MDTLVTQKSGSFSQSTDVTTKIETFLAESLPLDEMMYIPVLLKAEAGTLADCTRSYLGKLLEMDQNLMTHVPKKNLRTVSILLYYAHLLLVNFLGDNQSTKSHANDSTNYECDANQDQRTSVQPPADGKKPVEVVYCPEEKAKSGTLPQTLEETTRLAAPGDADGNGLAKQESTGEIDVVPEPAADAQLSTPVVPKSRDDAVERPSETGVELGRSPANMLNASDHDGNMPTVPLGNLVGEAAVDKRSPCDNLSASSCLSAASGADLGEQFSSPKKTYALTGSSPQQRATAGKSVISTASTGRQQARCSAATPSGRSRDGPSRITNMPPGPRRGAPGDTGKGKPRELPKHVDRTGASVVTYQQKPTPKKTSGSTLETKDMLDQFKGKGKPRELPKHVDRTGASVVTHQQKPTPKKTSGSTLETKGSTLNIITKALEQRSTLSPRDATRLIMSILEKVPNFYWTKEFAMHLPNKEQLVLLLLSCLEDGLRKDREKATEEQNVTIDCKLRLLQRFVSDWSTPIESQKQHQQDEYLALPRPLRSLCDIVALWLYNYLDFPAPSDNKKKKITIGAMLLVLEGKKHVIEDMAKGEQGEPDRDPKIVKENIKKLLKKLPLNTWKLIRPLNLLTNEMIHDKTLPQNKTGQCYVIIPDRVFKGDAKKIIHAIEQIAQLLGIPKDKFVVERQSSSPEEIFSRHRETYGGSSQAGMWNLKANISK